MFVWRHIVVISKHTTQTLTKTGIFSLWFSPNWSSLLWACTCVGFFSSCCVKGRTEMYGSVKCKWFILSETPLFYDVEMFHSFFIMIYYSHICLNYLTMTNLMPQSLCTGILQYNDPTCRNQTDSLGMPQPTMPHCHNQQCHITQSCHNHTCHNNHQSHSRHNFPPRPPKSLNLFWRMKRL